MDEKKLGDLVTGIYKTGKYIGEITAIKEIHYLVKVNAVLKHPTQGDLHNPKQAEVQFFHERRALALNEQTNIPKQMVKHYEGSIPDYDESLKDAITKLKVELEQMGNDWAEQSLANITSLEKDYFPNK